MSAPDQTPASPTAHLASDQAPESASDVDVGTEAWRGLPVPLTFLAGALMGSADSVPGVSGGTIALVLGIYERLVASIARVLRAPKLLRTPDGRRRLGQAVRFGAPILVGMVAATWVGTRLLVGPEEVPGIIRRTSTAPFCFAFFFGLVIASLPEPWGRIPKHRPAHWLLAAAGALLAGWFAGLPQATTEPQLWAYLYGGALAISVMLLPGVSGGLLLLVIGQYQKVAGAVHNYEFDIVAVFAIGMGLGLATFVPLLRGALRKFHDQTMALLTGLMAGSLRALWPWKAHYDPVHVKEPMANVAPFGPVALVLLAVVAGFFAAWLLRKLEHRMNPADVDAQSHEAVSDEDQPANP